MPTIVFITPTHLFDTTNGASKTLLGLINILAANGTNVISCSIGECPYPSSRRCDYANTINYDIDAVEHYVFSASAHRLPDLTLADLRGFFAMVRHVISKDMPDMLLTLNPINITPLLQYAKTQHIPRVSYFADASYFMPLQTDDLSFSEVDYVIVPSLSFANELSTRYTLPPVHVLTDIVAEHFAGTKNLDTKRIQARQQRYITMINPAPIKGGLFALHLVKHALHALPNLKFRFIESRYTEQDWIKYGVDTAKLTNLSWHKATKNMDVIYEQSAIVLVPSLYFEPSARVVAEALLCGLPVLAMDSGGIKEQLNNGGFVFDAPKTMQTNYFGIPTVQDITPWIGYIKVLMQNDKLYAQAVEHALIAANKFSRSNVEENVQNVFASINTRTD